MAIKEIRKGIEQSDFKDISTLKMLMEYQNNTILSLHELRDKYIEEKKQQQKNLLKQNLAKLLEQLDTFIKEAEEVNGAKIVSHKMVLSSMDELKEIGEALRNKLRNGVGLISTVLEGKINLVCSVSDNLIKEKKLNAGKLISEVAKELGGGGGGRPQLATAGAKDIDKLDDSMNNFINNLKLKL
jgi:alanyl-tRNA synthetase